MLGWSPPWLVKRLDDLGDGRRRAPRDHRQPGARALRRPRRRPRRARADARGRRGGPDGSPTAAATGRSSRIPNEGWATTVFGEPDVERLWEAVATAVRLDEPDPVAAWQEHLDDARRSAPTALNERRFDALRYRGPGTDLTVGLHPGRGLAVRRSTAIARHRARREHADRGGLHHPRRAARRRDGRARPTRSQLQGNDRSAASGSASRAAAPSRSTPTRARS